MRSSSLIREARLRAGLTQAELAERTGRDRSVIARWEQAAVTDAGPAREHHEVLRELADLANGTSASNRLRMRLSAYVLAARLVALAPTGFDHVFFTNSGSESVETALKIALAYNRARGEGTRFRLIGREPLMAVS